MTTRKAIARGHTTRIASKRTATKDKDVVAFRGGRIDFRVSPQTKALLTRAAALRGSNLTAFVLESAQERAVELIEQYEKLRLTDRDRDRLLGALDHPPAPVGALREAFRKYA